MSVHNFGIMKKQPTNQERFDKYEPDKYSCIVVDDDFIEPILIDLQSIDCYFHTLKNKGKGIAYCGITLIPPESMERFREILLMKDRIEYTELISLLDKGIKENRYIIHFGI